MNENKNTSPDMVRFDQVIGVIESCPECFANVKKMATVVRLLNNLQKYDLKPVADNITNNNITIVAENSKVRQMIEDLKEKL